MSEQTKTLMVDVWTKKPVSKGEIARAIDYFRRENVDRPDELILGVEAARELQANAEPYDFLNIDTYMGLKWKVDGELEPKEWRVRKSDVKVYALEEW